jgi:hypothetical protein
MTCATAADSILTRGLSMRTRCGPAENAAQPRFAAEHQRAVILNFQIASRGHRHPRLAFRKGHGTGESNPLCRVGRTYVIQLVDGGEGMKQNVIPTLLPV